MRTLNLTGTAVRWTLRLLDGPAGLMEARALVGRDIEAQVPGCVHTDLMRAGLLEDPYFDDNELKARWIGESSWRYTGRFDARDEGFASPPSHSDAGNARADLVFDGVDTLATVRLNEIELGGVDNMHATWRFDVRGPLRRGANVLEIDFPAPLPFSRSELERYRREIGEFPFGGAGANPQLPHHMLRKMHCNFGWDWGPQLVTCGIWRAVRIEVWETARIAAVRPQVVRADQDQAVVEIRADVVRVTDAETEIRVELVDPERGTVITAVSQLPVRQHTDATESQTVPLVVDQPRLWWPAGHGGQPLYALNVSLHAKDGGVLLDHVTRKIGLRSFQWVTTSDESPAVVAGARQAQGATFHLRVNGRRVFCKGANWIPDDCFPHRVTPERYRRRIGQARDANMNMLRVWGGGFYEDDAFYDACDELGIMVWQDFATACSCYPEDEAFRRRFEHEACDNVKRLAGRASLALWCGGNESIQATFDWGPEYRRMRKASYAWGRHYWYELFPRIVRTWDPKTFYWPNSPFSGADQHPANDEHIGDQHIWDVWNGQGDWRNYWKHAPRFASEFGFHGPPTWPTLAEAVPPEQRHWFSEICVLHNKQDGGQERAIARATDHFTLPPRPESPESFEAMWFVASLNQARAIQAACEWFRALSPWCSGALYWQLNDCWPVASWSAIDNDTAGLGRPKLLWYATRRFFAPRLCALLPAGAVHPQAVNSDQPGDLAADPHPRVYLHNDHPDHWQSRLRLRLVHFDGRTLEQDCAPFDIAPGGSLRFIVPGDWESAADRLVVAEADGARRAMWFFGRDKELPYPRPELKLACERDGGATIVRVRAGTLVRDLCIFPERLHATARITDQLISLLPGETLTLRIEGPAALSAEELQAPGIIWSANQFGRPWYGPRQAR